jgi:hypothetical protein
VATVVVVFAIAIGVATLAIKLKVLDIVADAYPDLLSQFPLPRWMARILFVIAIIAVIMGFFLGWLQTRHR